MASCEAEPIKLGVTDHANHAETGGGAEGKKQPTKRSDFNLGSGPYVSWVSVSDNINYD